MADESEKKQSVVPAALVPTDRDIGVLQAVHRMTDRVVLMPVILNGQPRIALALLCQNNDGAQYAQVLAVLVQPTDVVLDSQGHAGYNNSPPVKKDLN